MVLLVSQVTLNCVMRLLGAVLAAAALAAPSAPELVLRFEVCGGLTNQRIALIDGLLIAHVTNASVVLPRLNPNGVQTGAAYEEDRSRLAAFSTFFDVAA